MDLAPTVQPAPMKKASAASASAAAPVLSKTREGVASKDEGAPDDGTSQLLTWGGWTLGIGLLCAVLMKTVLGGISPQGPHTNSGWLALIVTMMCLPFGFLLFLLGALKWLRNRRHRAD
jgi:hypothetical protein